MGQFGESQNNQLCGKTITIMGDNGQTGQAVVADTNVDDTNNSIDMCMDLWTQFGHDAGGGRFMGKWKIG